MEDIKKELEEKREELRILEENENEEEYNDMLDECYEEIKIGYITFSPSRVLKELDPIAYNVGMDDYNSERIAEIEDEIEELEEQLKE
jgi:hypothetical protein